MSQTRKKPVAPSTPLQKLKAERVELMLARLPGWQASPDRTLLSRELELPSRVQAARFAQQAVEWASLRHGEPWFSVSQRNVQIRLSTPEVGGLTESDLNFARKLNQWVERMELGKKEKAAG